MNSRIKLKKINKILIFYNNFRGLNLSKYLSGKGFDIFNIITTKFLNKKILNKINSKNLKIIQNLKSKGLIDFIKKNKFDLIISAGFPHIFKKKFFGLTKFGIINLHAGKLPKYKGGSPLVWQMINNEKKIGLSVIKINEQIDGGKVICKINFKNKITDDIMKVHRKANKLFLKLTFQSINKLNLQKKLFSQPKSSSYFKQRKDSDAFINFDKTNLSVYNLIRAQSNPYKGAFFFNNRRKFRLLKCKMSSLSPNISNGVIFKLKNKKSLFIKCRINSIKILKIKPSINLIKI